MQLQKKIATHIVRFRDKNKDPIHVTLEVAGSVMEKVMNKEFIAFEDMEGEVHGEQWSNVSSVDLIKKKPMSYEYEETRYTPEQMQKRRETVKKVKERIKALNL